MSLVIYFLQVSQHEVLRQKLFNRLKQNSFISASYQLQYLIREWTLRKHRIVV